MRGVTTSAARAISLYTRRFPSADYTVQYLVIIPFTLDGDPTDGDGNNFEYSLSGS